MVNPAGNNSIYGVVHFKNKAVAVIPLDDNYNTWIVGQYRYPLDIYEWEVPEGGCPESEDPLHTAHRELEEEAGIKAGDMKCILTMQLSNSVSDEVSYSFVARNLSFVDSTPEETEVLQVKKIPFRELFEMTMRGEIKDALSVASVLKLKLLIDAGEI